MSTQQSLAVSRRGFLNQMTVATSAAFIVSALPLSSSALADSETLNWVNLYPTKVTYIDEALGNYPHYSEAIGYGRGHLSASEDHSHFDAFDFL